MASVTYPSTFTFYLDGDVTFPCILISWQRNPANIRPVTIYLIEPFLYPSSFLPSMHVGHALSPHKVLTVADLLVLLVDASVLGVGVLGALLVDGNPLMGLG